VTTTFTLIGMSEAIRRLVLNFPGAFQHVPADSGSVWGRFTVRHQDHTASMISSGSMAWR